MAITLGSNHGSLNGTNSVDIVAAPGASTIRVVRGIRLLNVDTAAVTVTFRKTVSGTHYSFDKVTALAVDGHFAPLDGDDVLFLTATTQSITAIMSGAAATTNPTFEADYLDKT
jgi:hypothetical protein